MKKILLLLDGTELPMHVIHSAIAIARADNALLHALFIVPDIYKATPGYPFVIEPALAAPIMPGETIDEESRKKANDNIQLFVEICSEANILFSTSGGGETSFDDLMRQSAFADLVMVDAGSDFPGSPFIPLMISLHDLLVAAHCPVLVLKEPLKVPRQIILSYDGSYSSIHAIKMFSYIFPEWRTVPVCLLSVYTKSNAALEYEAYIKDWLSHHFTSLRIDLLKGEPRKTLVDEVRSRGGDALVVMGAYGGSALSRMLHNSISNNIISETMSALFMSHERQNA